MSKDPAVLFYTSDFISGTQFFTNEECGQYIRLLCQQHQLGHIPENHMKIICLSYDSNVWKKFIKDENGNWYNQRMEIEKEKRLNYCNSRSKNKKGHIKEKSYDVSYENHMLVHMENENGNGNINGNKGIVLKGIVSLEEVKNYCNERNNGIDADKWFDFYSSKGWMIGKNKMKDWKAAVRTWEKNNTQKGIITNATNKNSVESARSIENGIAESAMRGIALLQRRHDAQKQNISEISRPTNNIREITDGKSGGEDCGNTLKEVNA